MSVFFKKVFSKKSPEIESVSKSFRIPKPMLEELEKQAADYGDTVNAFVVLVLDQYLQAKLEHDQDKEPVVKSESAS